MVTGVATVAVRKEARTLVLGVKLDVLGRNRDGVDWVPDFEAARLGGLRLGSLEMFHGLGADGPGGHADSHKPVLQLPAHGVLDLLPHPVEAALCGRDLRRGGVGLAGPA